MSLIGIDLGIHKIAMVWTDGERIDAYSYASTALHRDVQLLQLCSVAYDYALGRDADSVWIEDTIIGNNRKYSIQLAETKGAVLASLARLRGSRGLDTRLVDNKVWKKAIVGNGNASKDAVRDYIHVTHGAYAPLCGDDQDLYDAACIGLYGLTITERAAHLELVEQGTSYSLDDWLDRTGQIVPEQDSERWVSYNIADLYPEWQTRAHCAGVGVGYYFGDDDEQPTMSIKAVRRAAKLCEVCPVFVECLTWALTTREEYGVWAGTSGRVRRRIFKMVDNGTTTVAEVVERFTHGEGDIYRYPQAAGHQGQAQRGVTGPTPFPARRAGQGGLGDGHPGLPAEAVREAAI